MNVAYRLILASNRILDRVQQCVVFVIRFLANRLLTSWQSECLLLTLFAVLDALTTGFRTCFAFGILASVLFAFSQTFAAYFRALAHYFWCASTGLAVTGAFYTLSIAGHACP